MRIPIAWKLWLFVTVPVIAVLGAMVLFVAQRSTHEALSHAEQETTLLVSAYASRAEQRVRRFETTVHQIARVLEPGLQPGYASLSPDQLYGLIEGPVEQDEQLTGLVIAFDTHAYPGKDTELFAPYVFTRDGKLHRADVADAYDYRVEHNAWFAEAKTTRDPFWTDLVWGEAGQQWYVEYMLPLYEGDRFVGVVGAVISLNDFGQQLEADSSEGVEAVLFSRNEKVTYHTDNLLIAQDVTQADAQAPEHDLLAIHAAVWSGDTAALRVGEGDARKIVAHAPIGRLDWAVALVKRESEVLAEATRTQRVMHWFLVGAMLVLSAGSLLAARHVTAPLAKLRSAVHRVADGDFDVTVDAASRDECGDLAESFGDMVARLRTQSAQLAEQHAALEQYALYDELTGLPNRRQLMDRLQQTVEMAKRYEYACAVLFIDLDKFKKVNDTLGHDAGDELLREVSQRIAGCLRRTDVVALDPADGADSSGTVARLGGDEFVVLLSRVESSDDAVFVADRILAAVDAPFALSAGQAHVTPSIGIAIGPHDGVDADGLLAHADHAMYAAKKGGKNCAVMYSDGLSSGSTSTAA